MGADLWQVGRTLAPVICSPVTPDLLRQYAVLSGDQNPIHLDERAAKEAGFPGIIAHGMLNMGIMTRLVSPLLSSQVTLKEFGTRFQSPLSIGDCLYVSGLITSKNLEESTVTIRLEGKNQHDDLILKGTMVLKIRNV